MRKVLSVIVALAAVLCLLPAMAFSTAAAAPEGLQYKVVGESITITGYTGSATSLVIPASIDGLPVKTIGSYALSYKELTSVTLPNGLETIEASAFRANAALVSVIFPSSLKTIGENAFYECSALNPINLRGGVETIGNYAFFRTGARVAYLPANLKSIGTYAFGACSQLYAVWYYGTEAALSDVTMGEGNGYLTAADWHYNTCLNHTYTGDCDAYCDACDWVRSAPAHTYDDEHDTDCNVCGDARTDWFNYKILNGEVIISNFKGTTDRLVFPREIDNYPVTTIAYYACGYNTALETVIIPDSVTTLSGYVFRNCTNLKHVELPNTIDTINRYTFYECTSLTGIEIPSSVKLIDEFAFSRAGLTELVIPEGVETIGAYAYFCTRGFTDVYLPASVKTVGNCAFGSDYNLKYIWCDGSEADYAELFIDENNGYFQIAEWHYDMCDEHSYTGDCDPYCDVCDYIRTAPAHTYDDEHDTDCNVCGDARTDWFRYKVIEGGIQINEFRGTTERLVFPSEIDNLPVIAIANYCCGYNTSLVSVEIPDTVKTISGYAFRNCTNLQSIKLPADLEIINRYMFYECTSLTSIEIPANVKVIDEYAFARSGLTSLVLPEGVEAVNTFAFFRCVRMEEVFVSGTVSTIGEYAFFGCDELIDTWFTGTYEQLDNLKIAPNNAPLGGLRIDDLPTVYVSRVKAEAGNRVAVTVSIKNNPGVAVMKLKVGYDAAAMTLVDVVDGGILGTAMHAKTDADLQKQPYTVSWMNFTATKDFSENGVLVTLYFELSEDADGAYAITLNYGKNDILNTTVQEVPFSTRDGKVTVS